MVTPENSLLLVSAVWMIFLQWRCFSRYSCFGSFILKLITSVLVRSGFYMHLFNRVDVSVVDIGLPADRVKVNVQKTVSSLVSLSQLSFSAGNFEDLIWSWIKFLSQMDCFEVYALVPGLLREQVGESDSFRCWFRATLVVLLLPFLIFHGTSSSDIFRCVFIQIQPVDWP